jgi:hypothetical protein
MIRAEVSCANCSLNDDFCEAGSRCVPEECHENHSSCFGRSVRLTDERIAHILQHPELAGMEEEISRVLQAPAEVRVSRSDETVQLFYEYYARTRVGGKWLCVVVKHPPDDAFVVTAYLTDQLKPGELLWPKK